MEKKIAQLRGHYIVCGVGQIGSNVAQELAVTGRPFVMVDRDKANLENYTEQHPSQLYVLGDATDNEILLAAGIRHAVGVFAVAHDDNQNLVISLSAKQLNRQARVIARCHDQKNVAKIRSAGADEIVMLDFTGGQRLISAMLRPGVASFLDDMFKSDDNVRFEQIAVPGSLEGQALSVFYHDNQDSLVLAVQHAGEWLFNPSSPHVLHGGDLLMVMASAEGRSRIEQLMRGNG